MKVMISQPMRGKTNEQIRNERAELVKQLEEQGYVVADLGIAYKEIINVRKYEMLFPLFKSNTMYKAMKENKKYSLEELGL